MADEMAGQSATAGTLEYIARLSDDELREAIMTTTTDFTPVRLFEGIQTAIAERAVEESGHPVREDGSRIKITKGEMIAYVWQWFEESHPPSDGRIAQWVREARDYRAAITAEAKRRNIAFAGHIVAPDAAETLPSDA